MRCPKCSEGEVIVKKAKRRIFYGCSRYPDCDYSSWTNPMGGKKGGDSEHPEEKASANETESTKEKVSNISEEITQLA